MSVTYHDWQRDTPAPPYTRDSPNLLELHRWLLATDHGLGLGIYGPRPIKNPNIPNPPPSSHHFGAAYDYRYAGGPVLRPPTYDATGLTLVLELVALYDLIGMQMLIDYARWRIWKVGRGWKPHPDLYGGGDRRLHIETSPERWPENTPIATRLQRLQGDDPDTMNYIRAIDPPPAPDKPAPEPDQAIYAVVGDVARWEQNGNPIGALIAAGYSRLIDVPRAGLKAFTLPGPAPTYPASYTGIRTTKADFRP